MIKFKEIKIVSIILGTIYFLFRVKKSGENKIINKNNKDQLKNDKQSEKDFNKIMHSSSSKSRKWLHKRKKKQLL